MLLLSLKLQVMGVFSESKGPPGANLIKKNVIEATAIITGIANNILLTKIIT